MLIGLTNTVNNNAIYMKNMETRVENTIKENLRG